MNDFLVTTPEGKYFLVDVSDDENGEDKLHQFCNVKGWTCEEVHSMSQPLESFLTDEK